MDTTANNNAVKTHLFYEILVFVLYRCILKQFVDKKLNVELQL